MHYQYRFNQLLDALAGVFYLVHRSRQGAHPLLRIVVPTLLELNSGSRFVLDLLDHLAILADNHTDSRPRNGDLPREERGKKSDATSVVEKSETIQSSIVYDKTGKRRKTKTSKSEEDTGKRRINKSKIQKVPRWRVQKVLKRKQHAETETQTQNNTSIVCWGPLPP